jgi:hypothetical protein
VPSAGANNPENQFLNKVRALDRLRDRCQPCPLDKPPLSQGLCFEQAVQRTPGMSGRMMAARGRSGILFAVEGF